MSNDTDTRYTDGFAQARAEVHAVAREWGIDLDAPLALFEQPKTMREMIENKLHFDGLQGLVNEAMERRDLRNHLAALRAALGDDESPTESTE